MTLASFGEAAANIKASAAAANQANRYNRVLFKLNFMMLFPPSKSPSQKCVRGVEHARCVHDTPGGQIGLGKLQRFVMTA